MKKLVYILSSLFLLSAGFAACSCESEDPPEQPNSHQNETPVDSTVIKNNSSKVDSTGSYTVISTVEVSEEVKTFFDEALPYQLEKASWFTIDELKDEAYYVCHVINNTAELNSKYVGDSQLPNIDFNKYTLVFGQALIGCSMTFDFIDIHLYENRSELMIHANVLPGWTVSGLTPFRFWGLFPKIQNSISMVNYLYTIQQ